jgi:hypothetical protein
MLDPSSSLESSLSLLSVKPNENVRYADYTSMQESYLAQPKFKTIQSIKKGP